VNAASSTAAVGELSQKRGEPPFGPRSELAAQLAVVGPTGRHQGKGRGRRRASARARSQVARVLLTRTAREALAALDFLRADAVMDALSELKRDPSISQELCGRLTGLRSYRVGVYRIIYELRDDRTVRVVVIRHRGSAYDTDPR
jgi:mRNA interferase RelE/StbE